MRDLDEIVEKAMAACADEFIRGVHSYAPSSPDVEIPEDLVTALTKDGNLILTFTELFRDHPDRWENEGPLVRRSAFHAGSLAALRAHNKSGRKVLERAGVVAALKHINSICTAGKRVEYAYCQMLPNP